MIFTCWFNFLKEVDNKHLKNHINLRKILQVLFLLKYFFQDTVVHHCLSVIEDLASIKCEEAH
jgi:hypothetical protein